MTKNKLEPVLIVQPTGEVLHTSVESAPLPGYTQYVSCDITINPQKPDFHRYEDFAFILADLIFHVADEFKIPVKDVIACMNDALDAVATIRCPRGHGAEGNA